MRRRAFLQTVLGTLASLYCPSFLLQEREVSEQFTFWASEVGPAFGPLTIEMLNASYKGFSTWKTQEKVEWTLQPGGTVVC